MQDVYASDPDAAEFCIDLNENEIIVVTRKGTHGWIFGRVVHNDTGVPIEDGREGWWDFYKAHIHTFTLSQTHTSFSHFPANARTQK